MICTPEQAKIKWCPFVRFVIGPDDPIELVCPNRGTQLIPGTLLNCIATDCMAWSCTQHDEEAELGCCGLAHDVKIILRENY